MATLIRWTTGLVARIDAAIAQVENHEALADDAIRIVERGVGRARVHLRRVEQEGAALRARIDSERSAEEKWRGRVVQGSSEDRALECLRRARAAGRRADELEARSKPHAETERALAADLRRLEQRLSELRERRSTMRTRQARADAASVIHGAGDGFEGAVDDIFERWEMRLATAEVSEPSFEVADSFEQDFDRAEEDAELRAELAELRRRS